jgi:hypothetical protein
VGYNAGGLRGSLQELGQAHPTLKGVAEGFGTGSAILGGALAIPNDIGNFIAGQRQMGAWYQSILGGNIGPGGQFNPMSPWAAQSQRLGQLQFGMSQLGNLSPSQSLALWQGVTGLDMTGSERANAMQQAVDMYDRLGVSIQNSLQNITIAATSGNEGLNGLAQAITSVTEAAVQGQVNANVARANFTQNYAAATAAGLGGVGGAQVASGITNAMTGLGKAMAGVDTTGLYSTQNLLWLASIAGPGGTAMGFDQFLAQVRSGNGRLFTDAMRRQFAQTGVPQEIDPYITQGLRNMGIQRRGNTMPALNQDQQQQLVTQVLNQDTQNPALGLQLVQDFQAMGYTNIDLPHAVQLAIDMATGQFNPNGAGPNPATYRINRAPRGRAPGGYLGGGISGLNYQQFTRPNRQGDYTAAARWGVQQTLEAQRGNLAAQIQDLAGNRLSQEALNNAVNRQINYFENPNGPNAQNYLGAGANAAQYRPGGAVYESFNTKSYAQRAYGQEFNANKNDQRNWRQAASAIGAPDLWQQGLDFLGIGGQSWSDQAKSYYMQNFVKKGQQRNSILESMLKDPNLDTKNTVYAVNTGTGKPTYATLKDIEKDYMPYLKAGQVTVQTGAYAGQALSDIYGYQQGNVPKGRDTKLSTAERNRIKNEQGGLGKEVTKADKNIVYIKPTQSLLNLMSFSTTAGSGIVIDSNMAQGQTSPQYPTPAPGAGSDIPSFGG